MGLRPVAAPAFLSGKAKGGKHFRGQVCMVANNALPQCGTHITPLFQVPSPFPLDLSFLFASCGSFPFHLSFIPISRPSPPLHRRIHRGVGGSGPPRNLAREVRGVRVPVNYPQALLIKQVLYLYCMMDTAENINVWHSLAWT